MPGSRSISSFWILEDTSAYVERQQAAAQGDGASPVAVRLYKYSKGALQLRGETTYHPKKGGRRSARAEAALQLLDDAKAARGVIVAGSLFMRSAEFLDELASRRLDYVVAVPSDWFEHGSRRKDGTTQMLSQVVESAAWKPAKIGPAGSQAEYEVASLGRVTFGEMRPLRCVALAAGGIREYRRSIVVGVTSLPKSTTVRQAAALLGWVRWLRVATRRTERSDDSAKRALRPAVGARPGPAQQLVLNLTARVNLRLTRRQDQSAADTGSAQLFDGDTILRGVLRDGGHPLNVVELFAGAGGMGLGFLEARNGDHPYRIVFSGEVNPTYVRTL